MHLHGIPQLVIAKDGFPLPQPYHADTVASRRASATPCSSTPTAGQEGVWAFHCHILNHAERDDGHVRHGHHVHRAMNAFVGVGSTQSARFVPQGSLGPVQCNAWVVPSDLSSYGLEVLSEDECGALLKTRRVGRVAVCGAQPETCPCSMPSSTATSCFVTAPGEKLLGPRSLAQWCSRSTPLTSTHAKAGASTSLVKPKRSANPMTRARRSSRARTVGRRGTRR